MDDQEIVANSKTEAIIPVREQTVDFYGDVLLASQAADETIFVPLRPICDHLGLSWSGQRERTLRDPVLAEAIRIVRVTRTNASGGAPNLLCLPLDLLPGWLFGISTTRVREELQDKINRYRRDCFRILWNAFKPDILPTSPVPTRLSGAELALEIAEAVTALARQQVELENRYNTMADYMRTFVHKTRDYQRQTDSRLSTLELQVSGAATISEAQATEVMLAVKAVGQVLMTQGDRNGYQKVYSELYRRYGISSYKRMPAAKYEECLNWLHTWFKELGGSGDVSP